MEDQKQETEQSEQGGQTGKHHERSASYPGLSLDKAIEFAEGVTKKFPITTWVRREEYARIMKVHQNSVSRQFAACTQFGLFEKSTEGYRATKLLEDILLPENQKQKRLKKIQAFGTPKLYQALITNFDGKLIPEEIPNTLVKHHNITAKASNEAADLFIESGKSIEVITDNNVLVYRDTLSAIEKVQQYAEVYDGDNEQVQEVNNKAEKGNGLLSIIQPTNPDNVKFGSDSHKTIPIHLTKEKVAYFAYPADMSEKDVKLVEHQLAGILLRIQFENEDQGNDLL